MSDLPRFECFSLYRSERARKAALMRPAKHAGSTVGTGRLANRSGGKHRGKKAGKQKQTKVNVAKLIQKHRPK